MSFKPSSTTSQSPIIKQQIPLIIDIKGAENKKIVYGWRDSAWLRSNIQSLQSKKTRILLFRKTKISNIYSLTAVIQIDLHDNPLPIYLWDYSESRGYCYHVRWTPNKWLVMPDENLFDITNLEPPKLVNL